MNIEQKNEKTNILQFELPDYIIEDLGLPKLPTGYGLIGGAARSVALKLFFNEDLPIRDLDIAGVEEFNPDTALEDELGLKYMTDDYMNGHGVQNTSFTSYFTNRDLRCWAVGYL